MPELPKGTKVIRQGNNIEIIVPANEPVTIKARTKDGKLIEFSLPHGTPIEEINKELAKRIPKEPIPKRIFGKIGNKLNSLSGVPQLQQKEEPKKPWYKRLLRRGR